MQGSSCCTYLLYLGFSHFPHENDLFLVRFRVYKGWSIIGISLDAPKSNCLTQVWVNRSPMQPQEEFSLLLRSLRNQSKGGCLHGNEVRWPRETLILSSL